jgi:hypothetical protein
MTVAGHVYASRAHELAGRLELEPYRTKPGLTRLVSFWNSKRRVSCAHQNLDAYIVL